MKTALFAGGNHDGESLRQALNQAGFPAVEIGEVRPAVQPPDHNRKMTTYEGNAP